MNELLISHTSDIIQNYPNTMNMRSHEGKSVGVAENHRTTDQTQKSEKFEHRNIVRFQSFCDSLHIHKRCHLMN